MAPIFRNLMLLAVLVLPVLAKDTYVEVCPTRTPFVKGPKEGLETWQGNGNWFYYGCFRDTLDRSYPNGTSALIGLHNGTKARNGPGYRLPNVNAADNCARLCQGQPTGHEDETGNRDFGFPYSGPQNSDECYCMRSVPEISLKLPDSMCNWPCPDQGKGNMACGGNKTRNVYGANPNRRGAELYKDQNLQRGRSVASASKALRKRSLLALSAVVGLVHAYN